MMQLADVNGEVERDLDLPEDKWYPDTPRGHVARTLGIDIDAVDEAALNRLENLLKTPLMKTDKKSHANLTADIKVVREEKAGMESEPSVETEEDKAKDKKEELPVITRSTTETNRRPPTNT